MEELESLQDSKLVLAHKLFLLRSPDVEDSKKASLREDVLALMKADNMAELYQACSHEFGWELDRSVLDAMNQKNGAKLKKLEKKIVNAADESELREALLSKALFYVRIGDKVKALKQLKITKAKTETVEQKLDLVSHTLRLGFLYLDCDLIALNIEKAKKLSNEAGDEEQKNRLKVYVRLYRMMTKKRKKGKSVIVEDGDELHRKISEEVDAPGDDEVQVKKKKKKKKTESSSPVIVEDGEELQKKKRKKDRVLETTQTVEEVDDEREKKKKKKNKKGESTVEESTANGDGDEMQSKKRKKKKSDLTTAEVTESGKKTILRKQELETSNGDKAIKKTKKKVSFQLPDPTQDDPSENEVHREETEMDLSMTSNWKLDRLRPGLVWGSYTKEEDEALKKAVLDYIQEQGWEKEPGIQKIMSSKGSEARGCWHTIRKCLPNRELKRIYSRAHRLFDSGNYHGKWSPEETEALIELHAAHGNNWKKISSVIGRDMNNCKDRWRNIKFDDSKDRNRGPFTAEEQQKLCALVLKCLHVKREMAKAGQLKETHRRVRDDINWEFIAEQMGTRNRLDCMTQWYGKMASPMVATGDWSNGDDQRLLERLMEEFPLSDELVEWDSLLDNRSGETCKKRWEQMQRCLGRGPALRHLHFLEKLESLMMRFAPHLLETEYDQQFAAELQKTETETSTETEDDAADL